MAFVRGLVLNTILGAMLLAGPVRGEVPGVATDITPVHSLVAMVMGSLGQPDVIVTPGMSAHGNVLRPSQARALQRADLVIWMGEGLSPWLVRPIETLAAEADRMALLEMPGTLLLAFRDADHGAGRTGRENRDDHPDGGLDPHAWLDPENGRIWLGLIADRLAGLDPENAGTYRANALAGQRELAALQSGLAGQLAPVRALSYVTYHDAYRYFEARFGLEPVGSVTSGDALVPSPARMARLRELLDRRGVTCAFSVPGSDPGLLMAATGRDDIPVIPLDPFGAAHPSGPGLYPGLLRDMGMAFADCVDRH